MTRLRIVSCDEPGWGRRRRGRGFSYVDGKKTLSGPDAQRCKELVVPPAWTDVWICPHENGHLQAVGTDDAGRRQYLYHPEWRLRRDQEKFEFMLEFAARLPNARRRVRSDLRDDGATLGRVSALAFRMLDLGAFRIGSERYAEDNGSYGLLTLEQRHVERSGSGVAFTYLAKSGQERSLTTSDKPLCEALGVLRARRGPADLRLLTYKDHGRWHDLRPEQLNAYLKELLGEESSAKHFRTWQANVIAAAALALRPADSSTARRNAVADTMREAADFLGNTPAVARSGYVDPRLVDLYRAGTTIDPVLARRQMPEPGRATGAKLEAAVRRLLD